RSGTNAGSHPDCYTPAPVGQPDRFLPSDHQLPAAANEIREHPVTVLDEIVQDQIRTDLPELASGDTVRVSAKVVEGNRERVQVFEGTVMRLGGGGITRSITGRRLASGVGVERSRQVTSSGTQRIEV